MTGNNLKNWFLSATVLAALAFQLTGCSTKKLVQDGLDELYPDELIFLPTGSDVPLIVTFNDRWKVNAPDWIHCSQYSGSEGTVSLQLTTDVNRTGQNLVGTLSFDCEDGTTFTLPATQPCPYLRVSFSNGSQFSSSENGSDDPSLHFNWNDSREHGGRYVTVVVESNVDWRFDFRDKSTPETEFVLSQDHGHGSATLTLVPDKNNLDKQAYECFLTADAYMPGDSGRLIGEGVDSYSVFLHQKNLRFLINDSTEDIEVVIDELMRPVLHGTIEVDSELPWTLSGGTDWVSMDNTFGGEGISWINFASQTVNPLREERFKDIVLRSDGGAERVIHVRQNPFVFSLDSQSVTFDNEGLSSATLKIQSSGPWTVECPSWLTLSASGQEGDGTVTLSCQKQNLELTDLTGSVRFISQLNSLVENAAVSQDAFSFEIIPDETLRKIPALSTMKYPVTIQSSGAWSLSSNESWVSISSSTGTKNATVNIGSNSDNPDLDKNRSATVTIVSETHKANGITLKKEIQLTQTKFLFDITQSSTSLPAYSASSSFSLDIVCSEKWEIVGCPDWLIPEVRSGTYDRNLVFTVSPNTDKTNTRSGRIRVHSLYNDAYQETSVITQDKFVFNIDQASFQNLQPVNAGQKSITINCTKEAPWEIVSKGNWLDVNTLSGSGNSTLVVTPQNNLRTASRSSNLVIKNTVSNESLTVAFSQKAFVFSVTGGSSFTFDELDSSRKTISIDCSSNWTIDTNNASWLKLSAASGSGKSDVTLSVDKNVELKAREATITVYSNLQHGTSDELKTNISVKQSAYQFDTRTVSFTGLDPINEKGVSETVSVTSSGDWAVDNVPSWLKIEPTSGSGNGSIKVTPSTNTELSDRSVAFDIVSKDNSSLRKRVEVSQKAYVFRVDPTKMDLPSTASSKNFNIYSTAKWTVKTDQSWLTVSAKEGDGNKTVTVKAEKNTGKADRTGKVTITSQYGNHVLTIDVTQKKP